MHITSRSTTPLLPLPSRRRERPAAASALDTYSPQSVDGESAQQLRLRRLARQCTIRTMEELSQPTQERLRALGLTPQDFDGLKNAQRQCLLNVMATVEDAGLSLEGLQVARKDGKLRVNQERVFFASDRSEDFQALERSVREAGFQGNKFPEHRGIRESYRQPRPKKSLQVGFGKDGRTVEVDIDPNNPQKGKKAFVKHTIDVLFRSPTRPERVRNDRLWECECP